MATLDQLAAELVAARNDEALARDKRIQIEEAILAQIEIGDSERKTLATGNGLKLTVQTGLNYKLAASYPEGVVPVKETVKRELDVKAYEELRRSNPAGFAEASRWVTVTPKKAAVTVAIR